MTSTETPRPAAATPTEERHAPPTVTAPVAPSYPPTASGVPLAVAGFGFSLTILSLANTGIIDQRAAGMFVPVALGTGAVAMLVGGLWEFRGNNLFGATFGVAYACFLFTTALILQFYQPRVTEAAGATNFRHMFAAYLIVWALFTAMLTVGARYINAPAVAAFSLLVVVYALLGVANLVSSTGAINFFTKAGGWVGLLDSLAAFYLCAGAVLNEVRGRTMLPLWPMGPATPE
jgi:succinate-acetate transporter protein